MLAPLGQLQRTRRDMQGCSKDNFPALPASNTVVSTPAAAVLPVLQVRSLASETSRLAAQARRAGGAGGSIADMDWCVAGACSVLITWQLRKQNVSSLNP